MQKESRRQPRQFQQVDQLSSAFTVRSSTADLNKHLARRTFKDLHQPPTTLPNPLGLSLLLPLTCVIPLYTGLSWTGPRIL